MVKEKVIWQDEKGGMSKSGVNKQPLLAGRLYLGHQPRDMLCDNTGYMWRRMVVGGL